QPVRPVVHALLNKWEMHRLATQHDIPTATTACPASRAEVEEILETLGFPVVLKGADPFSKHMPKKKVFYLRQDLLDEVDRQADRGPLNFILQEYIPGDADTVWMCNGYFGLRSEQTVIFTGKKLRQ